MESSVVRDSVCEVSSSSVPWGKGAHRSAGVEVGHGSKRRSDNDSPDTSILQVRGRLSKKTLFPLSSDARGTHLGRLKDGQSSLDGWVDKVLDRVRVGQRVCSKFARSAEQNERLRGCRRPLLTGRSGVRHRIDTLHGLFEPVARDNVLDLDEFELIGMGRIPTPDVVGFALVADGALDSPAGLEEGVDHLDARIGVSGRGILPDGRGERCSRSWRGTRLRL
jgi:hypothetical protein